MATVPHVGARPVAALVEAGDPAGATVVTHASAPAAAAVDIDLDAPAIARTMDGRAPPRNTQMLSVRPSMGR
jgi:hypothetical protein